MGRRASFFSLGIMPLLLLRVSTDIVSRPIRTIRGAIDALWGAFQRDTGSLLILRESTRKLPVCSREKSFPGDTSV